MLEEFAIQQTLNAYSDAASCGDVEQLVSTYVADGVWKVPAVELQCSGHEEIRQASLALQAPMAYMVQLNSPARIQVDGDRAITRSVIRECGKYTDRDEALEILGTYEDELVRTKEGWKFKTRLFLLAGMHTFPLNPLKGASGERSS